MIRNKLTGLRGAAYYARLREILADCGQLLADEAKEIDQITPLDIGVLAIKYGLNFKATCEWLEESRVIPTGTYDRLIKRGIKISDILSAVTLGSNSLTCGG